MPSNIWDVLGKAGEGAARAAVASRNAKNTLQSELMLYKIKNQFEQAQKKGEMEDKFKYDMLGEREKAKMPFEAYDAWNQRQGQGNPGGAPNVTMGMDGKPKQLNLKERAELAYTKSPEQRTPEDTGIITSYETMNKPEKPLSGEAAVKYASSLRAIDMVRNIDKEILSTIKPGDSAKGSKDLIYKANSYINGVTAEDSWVPGAKGWYTRMMREKAGDKGAKLGNYFLNMAESLLRAESGAAVTDSELLRTKARSLFDAFVQSPDTWKSTLKTNLDFAQNIAKEIRPAQEKEWGYKLEDNAMQKIQMTSPDGKNYEVDAGEVEEARVNGWR